MKQKWGVGRISLLTSCLLPVVITVFGNFMKSHLITYFQIYLNLFILRFLILCKYEQKFPYYYGQVRPGFT